MDADFYKNRPSRRPPPVRLAIKVGIGRHAAGSHGGGAVWLRDCRTDLAWYFARERKDFVAVRNHAGEVLDFHALRHTCGAWLVLSGANVKIVQSVMRHSTIKLTLDTYGHFLPGQEAEAVDGPGQFFSRPEAVRKTGADDAVADLSPGAQ